MILARLRVEAALAGRDEAALGGRGAARKAQPQADNRPLAAFMLFLLVASWAADLFSRIEAGTDLKLPKADVLSERQQQMDAESDALFTRLNNLATGEKISGTAVRESVWIELHSGASVAPPCNCSAACVSGSGGSSSGSGGA